MADTPIADITKNDAAMLIVGLTMPRLIKYVRTEVSRGLSLSEYMDKTTFLVDCIDTFFNLPSNLAAKKAYRTSMYYNSPEILAKKVRRHVF
jgi:hypothetical protein